MEKKRLIIGPSHIARVKHYIKNEYIAFLFDNTFEFVGIGGAPIWCDKFKSLEDKFHLYEEVIFLVGDFRFGNQTTLTGNFKYGISKESICFDSDKKLYNKVMDHIEYLYLSYGNKVRFIFWDLALRENKNKTNLKYFKGDSYNHPIWNLDFVEQKTPSTLSLGHINKNNLNSLSIDKSNHPSIIGYFLLSKTFQHGYITNENIDFIKNSLASSFSAKTRNKIIGDSILVRTYNEYIDLGIINSPFIEEVSINELERYLSKYGDCNDLIYIANCRYFGGNDSRFLYKLNVLGRMQKQNPSLRIIFFDAFAQEVISNRNKDLTKLMPKHYLYKYENFSKSFNTILFNFEKDEDSLIELNSLLQPTFKMLKLLNELQCKNDFKYSLFLKEYKKMMLNTLNLNFSDV